MTTTTIEWTRGADGSPGMTWNPTLGCSKVGDPEEDECSRCYAISVAHRAMQPAHEGLTIKRPGERLDWSGVVRCLPERLDIPLRRKKSTTWFVDSMSDLFHPDVPDEFIGQVFDVATRTPQHTYQILTKRPQRMARSLGPRGCGFYAAEGPVPCPQPNIWLGTSIGRNKYAFRANHLRATPAAVRFLSLEPLLGPLPSLDLTGMDWVIVGGESGPGARPMHPGWVREIRDKCVAGVECQDCEGKRGRYLTADGRPPAGYWPAGSRSWADCPTCNGTGRRSIPFFFKQWGGHVPASHRPDLASTAAGGHVGYNGEWSGPDARIWGTANPPEFMLRVGKKAAGRLLDGREWSEMPR